MKTWDLSGAQRKQGVCGWQSSGCFFRFLVFFLRFLFFFEFFGVFWVFFEGFWSRLAVFEQVLGRSSGMLVFFR